MESLKVAGELVRLARELVGEDTWGVKYSYWGADGRRRYGRREFKTEVLMEKFMVRMGRQLDGFEVEAYSRPDDYGRS